MTLQAVSDRGSNKNELLEHAAEVLGRSTRKVAVFRAIYTGKTRVKLVTDLMKATGLNRIAALDAGRSLASQDIVEQVTVDGVTGYRKINFFQTYRDRILRLASNPAARKRLTTKRRPEGSLAKRQRLTVDLRVPKSAIRAKRISIDDVASFADVRSIDEGLPFVKLPETAFKNGIARILHEPGPFKDWGGESRDLSSTRLRLKGKRRSAAFAFKGPGKAGRLTPGKMGKNGDQIQRLLRCPAEVFFVQYWAEIDDSVLEQLEKLAELKSYFEQKDVWYGVIDGGDSARLIEAYPKQFKKKNERRAQR